MISLDCLLDVRYQCMSRQLEIKFDVFTIFPMQIFYQCVLLIYWRLINYEK